MERFNGGYILDDGGIIDYDDAQQVELDNLALNYAQEYFKDTSAETRKKVRKMLEDFVDVYGVDLVSELEDDDLLRPHAQY